MSAPCVRCTALAPNMRRGRPMELRCTYILAAADLLQARACAVISPETMTIEPSLDRTVVASSAQRWTRPGVAALSAPSIRRDADPEPGLPDDAGDLPLPSSRTVHFRVWIFGRAGQPLSCPGHLGDRPKAAEGRSSGSPCWRWRRDSKWRNRFSGPRREWRIRGLIWWTQCARPPVFCFPRWIRWPGSGPRGEKCWRLHARAGNRTAIWSRCS